VIDTPATPALSVAAVLLRSYGFSTRHISSKSGIPILLAENPLFALGVVEFESQGQLPTVEADAASELTDLLARAEGGPKQWDAYLVLLSRDGGSPDSLPSAVTSILHDTRYLRRLVRWDVQPDEESLHDALRIFLPLPSSTAAQIAAPLQLLIEQLPAHGVPHELARSAAAEWSGSRNGQR